jgi:type IV secretion system protein VirD4
MFSKMLDKETIDQYNTSRSRGSSESYSTSYQKLGKELMTPYELRTMDGTLCILLIKGIPPFKSKKYDPATHKNYSQLSDFDPKNRFDVENYLEQQKNCYARIRKNEVMTMYKV